jgi:D-threo-aldose 1-dehydrogenase
MARTRHWDRIGNGGVTVTELGFGSGPLGNLFRAISETEAQALLTRAWDAGVRYYDTAPLYGLGLAETRLNPFLRDKPRDSYVLSSKIGRTFRVTTPDKRDGIGKFFDVPSRNQVLDYGYDAVFRSIEFSLERLGLDRIDIIYAHDLDVFSLGSAAARDERLEEFIAGGYRALLRLRDEGVIKAFGAGVNEWEACQWLMDRGDFDIFLLAGRYTLLEQGALGFMNRAQAKGVGVVIGGPYNSGVLATGPKAGATFNYDTAPKAVLERVARLQAVCDRHGVKMLNAAFQFPLRHPAVISVIPGAASAAEMDGNVAASEAVIPAALWANLQAEGLMEPGVPL